MKRGTEYLVTARYFLKYGAREVFSNARATPLKATLLQSQVTTSLLSPHGANHTNLDLFPPMQLFPHGVSNLT